MQESTRASGATPQFYITDQQANWTEPHHFYWGFPPESGWQTDTQKLGDRFEVRTSLYRNGHPSAPSQHQPIYFDSLKMAKTLPALAGL